MTARRSPPADGSARSYLRDLIVSEGGSASFERLMHAAAYHPRFGYYARHVATIGAGGDFSTAATLHGALGVAVAAWAARRRAELKLRSPWHLVELGGGGGQLAEEVLRALGWWTRRGLRYHLVERSETLRREQGERLARWPAVAWHPDIESALLAADGRCLVFSNEFVDAFPCVRLEWAGANGWREVQVRWQQDSEAFAECYGPWEPTRGTGSAVCDRAYTDTLSVGQRVEWHRAYLRWLQGWVPSWRRGSLLTIDYGDELPAVYHRRPAGTVRGYFQHRRVEGAEIYSRLGRQDLTADVNFTDLQAWGSALGLVNTGYGNQAEFLRRWLSPGYLRRHEHEPRLAFLLDDAGAGGAFKVLEQQRGEA